jgi:hypothetical protein
MGDQSDGADGTLSDRNADASGDHATPPNVLEIDHVYSALAHPRRRHLCDTLRREGERRLPELASRIAAWENDVPVEAVTADQRDEVYVSLYHAHVPKLVDVGVLAFDEEREVITPDDHAEQVLAALDGIGSSVDSRQERHTKESHDQ